jgi:hypothetical protein
VIGRPEEFGGTAPSQSPSTGEDEAVQDETSDDVQETMAEPPKDMEEGSIEKRRLGELGGGTGGPV